VYLNPTYMTASGWGGIPNNRNVKSILFWTAGKTSDKKRPMLAWFYLAGLRTAY